MERCDAIKAMGQRLVEIRGELSQAEMARRLGGIHKNTLGTYERADREMGAGTLLALCRLGWSPLWVLTGRGPQRLDDASIPVKEQANDQLKEIDADIVALQGIRARLQHRLEKGE